jgi:hypothetical protein
MTGRDMVDGENSRGPQPAGGPRLLDRILLAVLASACLVAIATFAATDATESFRIFYVLIALVVAGYSGWAVGRRWR